MSKRCLLLVCLVVSSQSIVLGFPVPPQGEEPVSWQYSVRKKSQYTYEVHLTATMQSPWHIYSQTQPADAIPLPTQVKFVKNPMLIMTGKTKELGKKETYKDITLGSIDHRYSGTLDFVQTVTVKGAAKTNVAGTITYQLCTDERCLPPKTIRFSIKLE